MTTFRSPIHKGITCPNHGEPLEGIPFPTPQKGTGICPVSRCPFEFEADIDEETDSRDKFGNKIKNKGWVITGDDN